MKYLQLEIHHWTVSNIAEQLHVEKEVLLEHFKNYYLKDLSHHNNKMIMSSYASSSVVLSNDSILDLPVICDNVIIDFLSKLVTENDLDSDWIANSNKQSLIALQKKDTRSAFIHVLKSAKKSTKNSNNVHLLNSRAFEAFSDLFSGLLTICASHLDYVCAYDLLEIGGLYFRLIKYNDDRNTSPTDEEDENIEFLSERTCQHPLYQNFQLWRALMHKRLPVSDNKVPTSSLNASQKIGLIINEVHSLLYVMLGMGVNSSRALYFIQAVANDYNLDINEYFKLQRFIGTVWSSSDGSVNLVTDENARIIPQVSSSDSGIPFTQTSDSLPTSRKEREFRSSPKYSEHKSMYYSIDDLHSASRDESAKILNLTQLRKEREKLRPEYYSLDEIPKLNSSSNSNEKKLPLSLSVKTDFSTNSVEKKSSNDMNSLLGPFISPLGDNSGNSTPTANAGKGGYTPARLSNFSSVIKEEVIYNSKGDSDDENIYILDDSDNESVSPRTHKTSAVNSSRGTATTTKGIFTTPYSEFSSSFYIPSSNNNSFYQSASNSNSFYLANNNNASFYNGTPTGSSGGSKKNKINSILLGGSNKTNHKPAGKSIVEKQLFTVETSCDGNETNKYSPLLLEVKKAIVIFYNTIINRV